MTSLRIIIEDQQEQEQDQQEQDQHGHLPNEPSPVLLGKCDHCGGESDKMGPPLTCGCTICDCMCPKWHTCPKE